MTGSRSACVPPRAGPAGGVTGLPPALAPSSAVAACVAAPAARARLAASVGRGRENRSPLHALPCARARGARLALHEAAKFLKVDGARRVRVDLLDQQLHLPLARLLAQLAEHQAQLTQVDVARTERRRRTPRLAAAEALGALPIELFDGRAGSSSVSQLCGGSFAPAFASVDIALDRKRDIRLQQLRNQVSQVDPGGFLFLHEAPIRVSRTFER